jgi:hypothetical protein
MQTTAPVVHRVDPLVAFIERADAKAYLWSVGEYSIAEIVETMQRHAERDGLVERIGQDAVNSILNGAFAKYAEASS